MISKDLAYLSGVIAGDGSITIRPKKYEYVLQIQGNLKDEKEFYDKIICKLIKKEFGIATIAKEFGKNTYGVRIYSKKVVNYLHQKLEHPIGKKYKELKIPTEITNDRMLLANYLCGVADTDFHLQLKNRNKNNIPYPVITGVSKSKTFIEEIGKSLKYYNITHSGPYKITDNDARFKKRTITYRIQISGHKNLKNWMTHIGSRHPKIHKKIAEGRFEFGKH